MLSRKRNQKHVGVEIVINGTGSAIRRWASQGCNARIKGKGGEIRGGQGGKVEARAAYGGQR